MLVSPEWCRMMARYNAWQNDGLRMVVAELSPEALTLDRGAHFGSILMTLSHILWADRTWLARIESRHHDLGGVADSVRHAPDARTWIEARTKADDALLAWASRVTPETLAAPLTWTPASGGPPRTKDLGLIVSHMFNHQTHHRGQVHAMLTSAGVQPQATDLTAMPS